jgi:hypothetical protein
MAPRYLKAGRLFRPATRRAQLPSYSRDPPELPPKPQLRDRGLSSLGLRTRLLVIGTIDVFGVCNVILCVHPVDPVKCHPPPQPLEFWPRGVANRFWRASIAT